MPCDVTEHMCKGELVIWIWCLS